MLWVEVSHAYIGLKYRCEDALKRNQVKRWRIDLVVELVIGDSELEVKHKCSAAPAMCTAMSMCVGRLWEVALASGYCTALCPTVNQPYMALWAPLALTEYLLFILSAVGIDIHKDIVS